MLPSTLDPRQKPTLRLSHKCLPKKTRLVNNIETYAKGLEVTHKSFGQHDLHL